MSKYSLVKFENGLYGVKKHGIFRDVYVNLDAPHITGLNRGPYFHLYYSIKSKAERVLKDLRGSKVIEDV